ncbi:MAG: rhomboid family intramembrane serine protease [Bryobacteraceae bacterium]
MDKRRMCPHCRAFISSNDRICPYCEAEVGPRAVDRRPTGQIAGFIPHAHFTTTMILLVNFGLFAATALYSMSSGEGGWIDVDGRTLVYFGAKLRAAVLMGQWWRLLTAGFLHGGLLHILMNSWVLFDLGAQVEEAYGSSRLIVFYIVATFTGFFASTFWSPAISVGASAGLFGLIGAMIAVGVRYPTSLGAAIRGLYIRWAVYGLIFGLLPGLAIDNAAHIGGLAGGFGIAYLAGLPAPVRTIGERIWKVAAWVAVLVTIYCFVQWFMWFRLATA